MPYPVLAAASQECNGTILKNITTQDQRTLAMVEFVPTESVIPKTVDIDEEFDLKLVYRLNSIEIRNYNNILSHFPGYDGGFYKIYYETVVPYMVWWVWMFSRLDLYLKKGTAWQLVQSTGRAALAPPQKFSWQFRGTISDLLGVRPTSSPVTVAWTLTGKNYGWHEPSDFWPYDWTGYRNWFGDCEGGAQLTHTIAVNFTPTPPYPLFVPDGCSVSKDYVTPNEPFEVKATIKNQNRYTGSYQLNIVFLGNTTSLASGTIAGYQEIVAKKTVTANQLAGTEITSDIMQPVTLVVRNSQGETDRYTPRTIGVYVPPLAMGNLSGTVSDKVTGLPLAGVAVSTVGRTTTTNTAGVYSFSSLFVGQYTIEFKKTGYYTQTKTITISEGNNTLNFAMTPESEPPPPEEGEVPWKWVAVGVLGAVGLALLVQGLKGHK